MKINSGYDACSIIEDFADQPYTANDTLRAWAYLIKSGQVWNLQGSYGRGAADLIENGWISKTGVIHWSKLREYRDQVELANDALYA